MFQINIIDTGCIMADGGAMFGAIPKRAWQRKYPANDDNLCPLVMRCILAVSGDRKVLIDTGIGNKHLDKMSYYQPHKLVSLEDSLNTLGYKPEDITDVILTHLHFDHCGGATLINDNNELIPAFPNATYWLSRKQWGTLENPNRLEMDSILEDNIRPVFNSGQLNLVDKDTALFDGLEIRLFDGHTEGQLVIYLDTNNGKYVFPGDLIPTASHIPLEWLSAYDICALTSLKEKERFLNEAAESHYTLIYCHDAITVESKVKRLNDNFRMSKI
ncbi:MAG: MBL fold metallo-hydrolase [Prevotella sp.]|jgi:glyoxylase-like metal-dependent hydrolase (beta-lactamase superfamily II)|nr:MBL fold metallo-hydrolase [Prevotella sp.]